MLQPPIIFVSGLPRSGSTLLANLLGQNPKHHVTPTNAMMDMLMILRDQWPKAPEFQAQGLASVQPRIASMMRAMVEGFYRTEFSNGRVVFDKSRGWLACIEMMEEVLQRPISVLVTVRDIRAIVASFEKLYQRYPLTAPRPANYYAGQITEGRAAINLADNGLIGLAVNHLRDALRRQHKSRIILIPYNHLCRSPRDVLKGLHDQLGLPPFNYDPNHVEQITREDDAAYGAPAELHTIRQKVEPPDERPWEDVLPDALCDRLVREYPDIQAYAEAK